MSESSEHILDNEFDKTCDFTDDECLSNENKDEKNTRGKNKDHEPVCSFRSLDTAKDLLK